MFIEKNIVVHLRENENGGIPYPVINGIPNSLFRTLNFRRTNVFVQRHFIPLLALLPKAGSRTHRDIIGFAMLIRPLKFP